MRYFLRRRVPEVGRILLVESGGRAVMEKACQRMTAMFPGARFELCTCYPGAPASSAPDRVFRATDAPGFFAKLKMLRAIRRARPPVAALLFTGEPILFWWKLAILVLAPAKILVVNEHGDFFWLDWGNRAVVRQFMLARAGVNGAEILRRACRILVFPFVFLFLGLYALCAYLVRWTRLLAWKF